MHKYDLNQKVIDLITYKICTVTSIDFVGKGYWIYYIEKQETYYRHESDLLPYNELTELFYV